LEDLSVAAKSMEFDAVVHLAGEPLFPGRWTTKKKRALAGSRVGLLQSVLGMLREAPKMPKVVVSASAVGFYGNSGDEVCYEESAMGSDFLARLCGEWERVALEESRRMLPGVRAVALRLGVILAPDGGVLAKMTPVFRWGAGAILGYGRQWMSWVHVEDVCRAVLWAVEREDAAGVYNVVAPEPVTNKEFSHVLAAGVRRHVFPIPVAAFVLRFAFGEAASVLLSSQRVSSRKLEEAGFVFEYPLISKAINEILKTSSESL
jgi:uncharacterized protein (TIGR01777 family)